MAKSKLSKILLMPDLHAPYHSRQAFKLFCKVVRGWKPDTFVCLGDFGDCHQISTHPKNPKCALTFPEEIDGIRSAREQLDSALDAGNVERRVMLQGNHDTRIERFTLANAGQLSSLVDDWTEAYGLGSEWETVAYKESLQLGHLRVSHDFERAGVNAARQSLIDTGENIAFGHTHRLQAVYQGTVFGRKLLSTTLGWLGDPEFIDYRHRDKVRRDSIHAFGAVYMKSDGTFWLNPIPIVDGECVLDGMLYRA